MVPKPAEKAKEPTAEAKELDALRKQLKESQDSERYWADRARGSAAAPVVDEESDDEPEPSDPSRSRRDEKPEQFLDDVSKEGLDALKKRGVITKEELEDAIKKAEQRGEQRIANAQANATIDARIERDYPELKDPKSPLFERTGQHFRDLVADDPGLKKSPATLLAAAKMAKKELDVEKKAADEAKKRDGGGRRERIDAQSSDRGPSGRSEVDDPPERELSPLQSQIVKHLSNYGATEGAFKNGKH